MKRTTALAALLTCLALSAKADGSIVRCEVTDRTHYLMPAWIEYELRDRGTVLEIRDSVGIAHGVDWVRGEVIENTARRMTLKWDVGVLPIGKDWPGASATVVMRLVRLADGSLQVTGVPTLVARGDNTTYHGRALCSG